MILLKCTYITYKYKVNEHKQQVSGISFENIDARIKINDYKYSHFLFETFQEVWLLEF